MWLSSILFNTLESAIAMAVLNSSVLI